MMMMMGGNSQIITTQNEGGGGGGGGSFSGMNTNVGSGGGGGGGDGGGGGIALKKGPWTAAEDAVLAEYVRTHGEGNWNAVQKNTGLARCGKSCRLRWANHLRPNLKKGAFSPEEERIIVELHAKMGNKWARMATQLPGRTDNEIKNYWNTRVKRRQRQGLPLYPSDIQPMHSHHHHSRPPTPITSSSTPPTPSASTFSFQTPTTMLMQQPVSASPYSLHIPRSASTPLFHNYPPPPQAASTTLLPSPNQQISPSPLQSPHKHNSFSTLPLFDNSSNTSFDDHFFFPRPSYKRFKHGDFNEDTNTTNNNNDVNTCSSFIFPFSPLLKTSNNLFEPAHQQHHPSPQYPNPVSLEPITNDLASSTRNHIPPRPHLDSGQFVSTPGFVYPLRTTELPSNQLLTQDEVNRNNYGSSMSHSHSHHNLGMAPMNSGNGLLEDMLEEAHVLGGSTNDVLRGQNCLVGFTTSSSDHDQGFGSVMKPKQESIAQEQHELNVHDQEDYSRLLNVMNPPSSMPIPEWYTDSGGEGSNGQSSVITDDNLGLEIHHLANSVLLPVDHHQHHHIAPDHGRTTPSSRSWDNLPGSCQ